MKKTIAFLINNMELGGGTERVTSIIANKLGEKTDKIYILSCRKFEKSKFELNNNVNVISLCQKKNSKYILRKLDIIRNLKDIIKQNKIDVVIAVDITLSLYLFVIKIMNYKKINFKIISWEHFNFYSKRSFFKKIAQKIALTYSDKFIVLGKNDKKNYLENSNKDKITKKIEYIYNPISLDLKTKSSLNNKVVLAVGRLVDQKGFDMLIDAWKIVEKEDGEWILNIIGSGPKEKQLRKKIKQHKLNRINIIPFQKNIEEWYLNSSVFVLSSRYEGFVLVLLEAQAKGLPTISFNCKEGPSEIIDNGINGYLVEQNNTEMLAAYILKLISNENLRKDFGSKSQKDLERFDINKIIDKWIRVLQEI